jgi:hypothetical protein
MSRRHLVAACFMSLSLILLDLDIAYGQSVQSQSKAAIGVPSIDLNQSCDCAKRVGSCKATVTFKNGELNIKSSSQRCSLVVFRVNGDPRTSIVVNGTATEQWLGDGIDRLAVSSCVVCADNRKRQ